MSHTIERSKSGAPIFRHTGVKKEGPIVVGDLQTIEQIGNHVETYFGPVEQVFHELISYNVHVDVLWVKATEERPYHTLVTSGMSDVAMSMPDPISPYRHAELLIYLPKSWSIHSGDWEKEIHYWPIRCLKMLARLPDQFNTWLYMGHTIPNDDPPAPFAENTKLCCTMLGSLGDLGIWNADERAFTTDVNHIKEEDFNWVRSAQQLRINDEKTICFWMLIPLYEEEMLLKLDEGFDALLDRMIERKISPIVDIDRPNAALLR